MAAQAVCPADPCELRFLIGSLRQGSGNLRTAVQLPEGEDLQEWIAVHGECDMSCTFLVVNSSATSTLMAVVAVRCGIPR